MALGDGLGRHLEGHNIVRRLEHIRILKVNLVLGRRDFMMGGLYLELHSFQIHYNIPAHIFRQVNGGHIKIPCHFMGIGSWPSVIIRMEEEKFTLRAHMKGVAHVRRLCRRLLQYISWIPFKRLLIHSVDIADQARHLSLLRTPGKNLKGVQIRVKIHIGLIDADKAFNGRSVEYTPVFQRLRQLSGGNRHIFQHPENVRKLETDKLHILLLHHPDNVILAVFAHFLTPLSSDLRSIFLEL